LAEFYRCCIKGDNNNKIEFVDDRWKNKSCVV